VAILPRPKRVLKGVLTNDRKQHALDLSHPAGQEAFSESRIQSPFIDLGRTTLVGYMPLVIICDIYSQPDIALLLKRNISPL